MAKYIIRQFCSNINNKELVTIRRFTQKDLDDFSNLTGDRNPIHSSETSQNQRKVHGAFLNAVVAGIIGTKLPGPGTIVLEQKYKFPKACRIDADTEICLRLVKERKISVVEYVCRQNGDIVFEGEAKLLIKEHS